MLPSREHGDTRRLQRREENDARFQTLRCKNRPPENGMGYGSHRPVVGEGRSNLSTQTVFAVANIGARRSSAHQTGREGWGCCGCRFSQHRLNKREAFWFSYPRQVPLIPRRVHEADAAIPTLVAGRSKRKHSEHYKNNSTLRNKYAGKQAKMILKPSQSSRKLHPLHAKKCFYISHLRVLREQPLR